MEKMNFLECTRAKLEGRFGIRKSLSSPVLDSWLKMPSTLSEHEQVVLKSFQKILLLNSEAWNEHELSMNFIGPIFAMVNFNELYRFKLFSQRKIGTIVSGIDQEIDLSGEPDGIIATGFWEPEVPIFAFSEYKRKLDSDGDPAGQALAAMLVGQTLNNADSPLYGCYVVGHDWYFLVLDGKHYTISRDYSANTDEIMEILRILKSLKQLIMDRTA